MAIKATIYFPDNVVRRIGDLPADVRLSARITDMLDRYGACVAVARREVLPLLTHEERLNIRSVCMCWITRGQLADALLGGLAAEVEDSALPGGDLEGQDVAPLVAKLRAMTPIQQFALIEWIESQAELKQ